MENDIQILDCTLRDGGMELQSALKYGYIQQGFSVEVQKKIVEYLRLAGIDIIESCSISEDNMDRTQFAVYGDIYRASDNVGLGTKDRYAALFMGPNTEYSTIPYADETGIKIARMMLRYSELDASLDLCRELSNKGYQVSVQPSITMRYSDDDLDKIINLSNEISAYSLYIVDSYGYMSFDNIKRLFDIYDTSLDGGIRIGLHAHNNLNLAYSNVQQFLGLNTRRGRLVDSCLCGLGQGAGNLQTELMVHYAIKHKDSLFEGREYDIIPVLEACEIIDSYSDIQYAWGYSVPRMISAICQTSYKYADVLRTQYGFTYSMIYKALHEIKDEEYRQRYTDKHVAELAFMFKEGIE